MAIKKAEHVYWHQGAITRKDRQRLNGHRGFTVWFTGLSGSGKSTLAVATEEALYERGFHTFILDGDNVRHGLNRDLGFTDADRVENIRRVAEAARLFVDAGVMVLVSFISPFRSERDMAREMLEEGEFYEVYVNTPLEVCEARDPKGLYKKARAGQLQNFTGIDSAYETPENPEITVNTAETQPEELAEEIVRTILGDDFVYEIPDGTER